ncbi:hypothetical protein DL98DRAFT_641996 [Cadophora sp. DSE1049]|nr:hypothetical protein DL98DRAFT_641996 [Cadophora sp. DSE1049]
MAVPYSSGLMGPQSDREIFLPQSPTFTERVVILINWTSEEVRKFVTEVMLSLRESCLMNVAVFLVRSLKADLSLFGKASKTGDGLGPPSVGNLGDPSIAEDLLKGYDKWPEEPNIIEQIEGKHLLKGYDKWPEEPNIRKSMGVKDHHEGYDKWPEESDIRLSVEVEDFHENSVPVDGDPDVWKDPLPDHRLHARSDYSRAYISPNVPTRPKAQINSFRSHCPECDGTGSCSCSYLS